MYKNNADASKPRSTLWKGWKICGCVKSSRCFSLSCLSMYLSFSGALVYSLHSLSPYFLCGTQESRLNIYLCQGRNVIAGECLTVGKITQKVSNGFCWKSNFHQMLILGPETDAYTVVMFWNLILRLPMLFYTMGVSHIMWENDLLVEVCTPVVLLHIFSFKLTSEICQLLALIHSVEWHQAEGNSTKISSSFTVFCQTSLVISQQRVTVYENAHAHSALRTELKSLSLSFYFLPMMSTTRILQRFQKDLPAVSSLLRLLWLSCDSVSAYCHFTFTVHPMESKSKADQGASGSRV